jgi:RNA 3'-terminal phosphate cyclase (ATP)
MIRIDGARLEGGGQVVRGAVALSALTGEAVEISNIRRNRTKPGFAPQHIAAVRAVAALCDAECEGLSPGSGRLRFTPGPLTPRACTIDIGTAGSIPLVLQAWLPVALAAGGAIRVTGGTEVTRSPTIDYCDRVFCGILRSHGAAIRLEILRRGYFPQGGGEVFVRVERRPLRPLAIAEGEGGGIVSCSANLPGHVAERQAAAAFRALSVRLGDLPVTIDRRDGISTGSSVTVWRGAKGGTALGRRGYPAEEVGREAAGILLRELDRPGRVDAHLADQLIIILARTGGAFTTAPLSLHAETMCWLAAEFGSGIAVRSGEDGAVEVSA